MSVFKKLKENRQKNILLITPTSPNEIARTKWLSANLGIERVAGYLNSNGHYAETYDTNLYNTSKKGSSLSEKFIENEWDVIGFSIQEDSMIKDIENMMLASSICPNALIVAGGHTAQFDYQTLLDKSPARVVVIGEGEKPMLKLVNGTSLEDIPGIVVKNFNIPLTTKEFKEVTENIDYEHIPYEKYWDFYIDLYKQNGYEITPELSQVIHTVRIYARNYCPMNCKFCSTTNFLKSACGTKAVPLADISGKDLVDLLKRIIKAHPRVETFYFTDDDFCSRRKQLIVFLNLVIEAKLSVTFFAFSRIDDLDEEVVSLMVNAGFRSLHIGVENFQPEILKELNKKVNLKTIDKNLDLLNSYGMKPSVTFILCTPNSKLEWIENTSKRILIELEKGRISPGLNIMAQPQMGSRLFEEYEDFEMEKVSIPNTNVFISRNYFIKCTDPETREFQYRFLHRWAQFIEELIASKEKSHLTSPDQTPLKLRMVLEVIDEIKSERGRADQYRYSNMSIEDRHKLWSKLQTYKYGASI